MKRIPCFCDACHLVDLPAQLDRYLHESYDDPFIELLLQGLVDMGPIFRLQAE
jgi:hypothetical protein